MCGSIFNGPVRPHAHRRISREEGIKGLYSGLAPSLAGVCHVAIQFPLYEGAKQYLATRGNSSSSTDDASSSSGSSSGSSGDSSSGGSSSSQRLPRTTDDLTVMELVGASAFSKVVAATITYPHEVGSLLLMIGEFT